MTSPCLTPGRRGGLLDMAKGEGGENNDERLSLVQRFLWLGREG